MNLQEKPSTSSLSAKTAYSLGLYVHVPFCATTCDFCAFYQKRPARADISNYIEGIKTEIARYPESISPSTIFWGGGTPGLLPLWATDELGAVVGQFLKDEPVEWTVEMAPSTINPRKLKLLKSIGVNRISMGVQSFDPEILEKLGRDHSLEQIERSYQMIRDAGFENVNIDMMFAFPGQKMDQWESDLQKAVSLKPEHISTYCLTFEEDTALWVKLQEGKYKLDVEVDRRFYEKTWETLEAFGYKQYEVSNYALPGYECAHNLNTWNMDEWIGLGPSASSQFSGSRYTNVASLEEWFQGIQNNKPEITDVVALNDSTLAVDAIIFGLRKNSGVDLKLLQKRFPSWTLSSTVEALLEKLTNEDLIVKENDIITLTPKGRLLADAVGAEFIDIEETMVA